MSWDCVNVFQHGCEYKGSKPTLKLFVYLFEVQNGSKSADGSGNISLQKYTKYFEPYYQSVKHLNDQFFLLAPLIQEAHSKLYNLNSEALLLVQASFASTELRVTS